jgi:hypothetical protein
MYTGIKHLHSFTAYLSLALLLLAIIVAVSGLAGRKPFTKGSKTIAVLGLAGTHLQLVFGLVLYFVSPLGLSNFSGESMKISTSRLYMLEHPLMMIIGLVLITIGYSKAKRLTDDRKKYKAACVSNGRCRV